MKKLLLFLCSLMLLQGACVAQSDTTTTELSSRYLIFPFFLRSPETSWGFGAAAAYFFKVKNANEFTRTSDVNLIGLYTLKSQAVIVANSTVFFPDEDEICRFQTSYSIYPDKFWGIGNETADSAVEDYSIKQFYLSPQVLFRVAGRFYIGTTVEIQTVRDFEYDQGGVFDSDDVPGRTGGFTSGLGLILSYDSRNNAYSPDKGSLAEFNATRFTKTLGSDFTFTSYSLDLRTFFKAGKGRVLGLHSLTRINNGETPVRYLAALGGNDIMRGYYKGRYTDNDLFAMQAELRQFIYWRIGVVGFAGLGQVAGAIKEFGLDRFHYSYGGGIRFMVQRKEKLNLRIDFGFGQHSHGMYVILKEAF
jgi:outer membrane protein assembly factor BamA